MNAVLLCKALCLAQARSDRFAVEEYHRELTPVSTSRSYAAGSEIHLRIRDSVRSNAIATDVMLYESLHVASIVVPRLAEVALAYRDSRTQGEKVVPLGSGYAKPEMTRDPIIGLVAGGAGV